MKSKNKDLRFGVVLGICICVLGLSAMSYNLLNRKNSDNETINMGSDIMVDAKIEAYDSLSEVEAASDIIVLGKKVSEDEPTIIEKNGYTFAAYTLSGFEIESIKKNSSEVSVEVGQTLTILENEAYDESDGNTS